ncbi:MAG TPA: MBL fold metallo-hydrolase, partial [Thermoanaerobaculia bacterium]|nr:MBL fold metallo-hydrolase [Thermoanaerobaculia bacterium]
MNVRDIVAPNPGPFTLQGTRTYILDDRVVIDPGPAIESHVDKLAALHPQTILITHRHGDHAPAAVPLKGMTGARIVAPVGVLDDVDQRVG